MPTITDHEHWYVHNLYCEWYIHFVACPVEAWRVWRRDCQVCSLSKIKPTVSPGSGIFFAFWRAMWLNFDNLHSLKIVHSITPLSLFGVCINFVEIYATILDLWNFANLKKLTLYYQLFNEGRLFGSDKWGQKCNTQIIVRDMCITLSDCPPSMTRPTFAMLKLAYWVIHVTLYMSGPAKHWNYREKVSAYIWLVAA